MHRITPDPLDLDAAVRAVASDQAGAVVTFVGTVRSSARGRRVLWLDYEAYAPMALRIFNRVAGEAAAFGGARVAIHHRIGRCVVGETSVVIAAASAHRAEAFEACRHAIERLKADAPIWKRERYEDGEEWIGQGS